MVTDAAPAVEIAGDDGGPGPALGTHGGLDASHGGDAIAPARRRASRDGALPPTHRRANHPGERKRRGRSHGPDARHRHRGFSPLVRHGRLHRVEHRDSAFVARRRRVGKDGEAEREERQEPLGRARVVSVDARESRAEGEVRRHSDGEGEPVRRRGREVRGRDGRRGDRLLRGRRRLLRLRRLRRHHLHRRRFLLRPGDSLFGPGPRLLPFPSPCVFGGELGLLELGRTIDGARRGTRSVPLRRRPEGGELEGLEVGVAVDEASGGEVRELDGAAASDEGLRARSRGDDDDGAVVGVPEGDGGGSGGPRGEGPGGLVEEGEGEDVAGAVKGLEEVAERVGARARVVHVRVAARHEGVHDRLRGERGGVERDADAILGEELHAARSSRRETAPGVGDRHAPGGHDGVERGEDRLDVLAVLGAHGDHEERVVEALRRRVIARGANVGIDLGGRSDHLRGSRWVCARVAEVEVVCGRTLCGVGDVL